MMGTSANDAPDAGPNKASTSKQPSNDARDTSSEGASGATTSPTPTFQGRVSNNTALLLSVAGLLAFWKGWSLFVSVKQDRFSHAGWLILIALVLVTLSAFHFLGASARGTTSGNPTDAFPKNSDAKVEVRRPIEVLGSLLPALPFLGIYCILWWALWSQVWRSTYPGSTWLYFVALIVITWGAYVALKPPSEREEDANTMPTRRVIMLIMLPFGLVYGMIWFSSLH